MAGPYKMMKDCGPISNEVKHTMDSSKGKNGANQKQLKDLSKSTPVFITSKEKEKNTAPTGDENLHAKLEDIIRSSGYGSAAWIIETSKLFI